MFTTVFDKQKFLEQRIREIRQELEATLKLHAALKAQEQGSPKIRVKKSFTDVLSKMFAKI
jgi:hypothetical protein